MPRSLNLPQAILAIALHAAGRPLLTQELAVLAGKPQEAIASLLEPLLGAGFAARAEAPDAWVCPGLPDAVRDEFVRLLVRNAPPGSLTHALARLGAPDMALDDCNAIAEAIKGTKFTTAFGKILQRLLRTAAPPSPRPSATSSASSGRAASSAWNARCVS